MGEGIEARSFVQDVRTGDPNQQGAGSPPIGGAGTVAGGFA